ncbi:hypothetical protein [Sphingomonas parva]|uniref:hypothetical protein n=1 Tax=Sphingomonas parva TaxID=2555898 RepID=UPI001431A509|nr:hypothetical protein [Sphingomonas parva]
MKSALAGFALTAALLVAHVQVLPNPWPDRPTAAEASGFAQRHANEDTAKLEKELGL